MHIIRHLPGWRLFARNRYVLKTPPHNAVFVHLFIRKNLFFFKKFVNIAEKKYFCRLN